MAMLPLVALTIIAAPVTPSPVQYALEKKIAIGGDGGWDCLTMDSASHRLFITRGTHVQVLDVESGKIVADIPNTQGVHAVAVVDKLRKAYITCGRDDSLAVIDLATLKETKRIKVGSRPDVILFDPSTDRVFSFNAGSQDASAVDVKTDAVVGCVKLEGKPEFAVSDGHGSVFVNLEDKSEIEKFDAKSLSAGSVWALSPGEEPTGLGVDLKRHLLFSVCANEMMTVTDFRTGKIVATPKIGKGPDGAWFDPGTGMAISPNGQDGTLTLIGMEGGMWSVKQTLDTQRGARTMAVDPKTHKIYLLAAQFETTDPSAPSQRPRMVAGSATILVVSPVKK